MLTATVMILLAGCRAGEGRPSAAAPPPPDSAAAAPRNVILFVGDGMGVATVTAARIYDGQSRGESGEENILSFERFPRLALVKTYNTNAQVPDSAGTATAMNSGVKTRAGAINVGPVAAIGDCRAGLANSLRPFAVDAHAAGMAVGIVSTARITHATPAAVYAQTPDRDWESDAAIPAAQRGLGCTDIATQLLGFPFDVALGGGRREFLGTGAGGRRLDPAADLVAAWTARTGGRYVTDRAGLLATAAGDTRPLLGLFTRDHMGYSLDRTPASTEPTLTEMTVAAIDRLKARPGGYYLMVEAGRIDHAHHEGHAGYALAETQELARAVAAAVARVDPADTLVLVTADHSHVMGFAGYPARGNPILGVVRSFDDRGEPTGKPALAADGQPYTTLGYLNGPGAVAMLPRPAPAEGPGALQQALVPTGAETHGGEDVALYATGPGAEMVGGVIEQDRIRGIMAQTLRGPGREQGRGSAQPAQPARGQAPGQ
jgi:alkaline phosphatase